MLRQQKNVKPISELDRHFVKKSVKKKWMAQPVKLKMIDLDREWLLNNAQPTSTTNSQCPLLFLAIKLYAFHQNSLALYHLPDIKLLCFIFGKTKYNKIFVTIICVSSKQH